jgi:uncharacterized membrane protein
MRHQRAARIAFGTSMIALATMGFLLGDFSQFWVSANELPASVRHAGAYASAVLMMAGGVALLARPAALWASRLLVWYWAVALLLVKVPVVATHPLVEVAWQDLSQFLVILAGAWTLVAAGDDKRWAARDARLLFGFALIPLGLAHFFYMNMTAPLVPSWLPWHNFWAYFTGAAQIAAGIAVLIGVYARLAAALDAVLLALFTFLVWMPLIAAKPGAQDTWSEFTTSWAVCAAAWVVAVHLPSMYMPEKSESV